MHFFMRIFLVELQRILLLDPSMQGFLAFVGSERGAFAIL